MLFRSALLTAATEHITQVVASVPFIWVMPLALYLITFIIAFRGWASSGVVPTITLALAVAAFSLLGFSYEVVTRQMVVYVAYFFFAALFCHAALFAQRPPKEHSSLFYVCIACGGMLGTLLVSIIAPLIFSDIFEFPLGILTVMGAVIAFFPAMRYIRDEYERSVTIMRFLGLAIVLIVGVHYFHQANDTHLIRSRNFYGITKI